MSLRLYNAVRSGNLIEVQRVLNTGEDIDVLVDGLTALYYACHWDKLAIAELLIMRGADVNLGKTTPLMAASSSDNIPIINLLITNKADINKKSDMGLTAIHFAVTSNCINATKVLLENKADYEIGKPQGWAPLQMAEGEGYEEIAKLIKEKMASDGKTLPGTHSRIRS